MEMNGNRICPVPVPVRKEGGLSMEKLSRFEKQVFKEVKDQWDALFIICESSRESRNSHKQYEKNLKGSL